MKKIKLLLAAIAAMVGLGAQAQTWTGNDVAAGDFYLYNVGAGQWLTSGNSWGTQASLTSAGGFCITLEGSESTFSMKVTETRTNNKTAGPGYVGTGGYMDSENAENWTFTKVEQGGVTAYRITSGDNALKYSGNGTVVNVGADATDNSLWVLVSQQDRLDAMAAADADHPVDATFLLKNPDFGRYKLPAYDVAWTWTFYGSGTNHNNSGDNTNLCVESYHQQFDYSQVVADAPYGNYGVRCQAFYRQDGSNNTDLPYVYVNEVKANFPAKTGGEGSMNDASISFTAGNYWTDEAKTTFAGGTLTVGTHLENNTSLWCIWDNIQLKYYGPIDLSEFETQLAVAVSAAQAYETQLPTAVYTNIANVITEQNKTWSTADEYSAAITAINNAVSTYATAAIIADYARYKNIRTAVLAINGTIDVAAANTAVDAATSTDDIDAAVVTLRAALATYLAGAGIENDNIDLTAALIDNAAPGTSGKLDYWTNSGNPGLEHNLYEYYNVGSATSKQTIATALPIGYYKMTVIGYTREGYDGFIYAGEKTQTLVGVSKNVVNTRNEGNTWIAAGNGNGVNEMIFNLTEATSNLEIGINSGTVSDYWTVWRSFKLEYLGTAPLVLFQKNLADAATAANAHATELGETIPAGAKTTYTNAISAAAADNSAIDKCLASIAAIETATAAADAAVTSYANYNTLRTAVQDLYDVSDYEELTTGSHTTLGNALTTAATDVAAASDAAGIESVTSTLKAAGVTYAGAANPTNSAKFNLTFMLTNPNLEGLPIWNKADGWYTEQTDGNSQVMTNANATSEDGTKTAFFEYWRNPAAANNKFALYQNVTLAAGTYNMSCYAFAQNDQTHVNAPNGVYFYANDVPGSAVNNARLTQAQIDFVNKTEQDVKIGLKTVTDNANFWMGIGYVELYKVPAVNVTIDETVSYTPESIAGKVTLKRTINADVWNTFVVPFQLTNAELRADFGDDVEVAEFSDEGETADAVTVSFTKMATPAITPNKPVLLKTSTGGNNYVFENRTIATGDAKVVGTYFDFVGTYAASTPIAAGDYFISSSNSDGVSKLYKSAGATTIQGTRAYLKGKSNEVKAIKFFIDGQDYTTAIEGLEAAPAQNGAIYNIAGQRVSKAQKGIFIVNGKKVVK